MVKAPIQPRRAATVSYFLIPLLLVFAGLVVWYFRMRSNHSPHAAKGEPIDTVIGWQPRVTRLMTAAEQQAYDTLREALPEYMVLSQVPLSRFIKVSTRNSYVEWLRRVGHQCSDLIICDRASKVFAVVEVRGSGEQAGSRAAKRNARKARTLKAAGVALHIWPENGLPSAAQVRQLLWSSSPATTGLSGLAPAVELNPAEPLKAATAVPPAANDEALVVDTGEFNDAPPSTWFDDLDSAPVPLEPLEQQQQQHGGTTRR